jgi:hypothetical protein
MRLTNKPWFVREEMDGCEDYYIVKSWIYFFNVTNIFDLNLPTGCVRSAV